MEQLPPVVQVEIAGRQAQVFHDQLVQTVVDQAQRHFVDRKILIPLLDHRLERHVAEQGHLFPVLAADLALGAADQNIGLDTDLPQQADRMLGGLGLQLAGRLQIGDQRQVDVQAISLADVERELADGLQKRLAFDVAHRAADLGDHDVDVVVGQFVDAILDFVGDVGDDLDGFAQEFAPPLLVDHRQVDLAGGVVRVAGQGAVGEAFVMAQVQVGLAAVVQHVDFAVLVGTHRAGVDVDVGIELLHPHPQAAPLEQHADRGAGEPLA